LRFALYGQINQEAGLYTLVAFVLFLMIAVLGYNPSKGMMKRKGR